LDDTTTHVDDKKIESQIDPVTTEIEPRRLRPSGQIGLDSYPSEEKPERLIDESQIIDTETIVESLELDLSNVAFDGVAVTVCENLEGTALVARLKQNGLTINLENLEQGDLRMAGNVLVELKSTGDFVDSLAQGRLLEQVSKLVNSSSRSIMIVEGNDLFMHQTVSGEAIMGAVSTLTLDYGVPVITSASTEETARFIAISARRETKMIEQLSTKAQERLTSNNGRE
ncbi:MAG: ERCC4 domain-containing protein, partial [Candidatus Thermoplasmatota archaeon]|nr:ERCC4 domain-containing protein [Candidatus Thermoplasmatota archaeon]